MRQIFSIWKDRDRFSFGPADIAIVIGAFGLLALLARVSAGAFISFIPPDVVPSVSLDPAALPYYVARSALRMFIALGCSLLFTMVYGYIAAHNRRAERVLIPLLDILQSVPVLGFLSVTVTGFIALFPGSLLGLETASIFAIFTSQAWNMTFSFYQSLRTLPRELDEVTSVYRLSRWERFTRLEVPSSMIGLVWNSMMSFGGGWFFVAASEAISVLNAKYTLPGIGAYVTLAVERQDMRALAYALLAMALLILLVDQLFWRPLVAWAEKFRLELSTADAGPTSWLLNLIRAARLPRFIARVTGPVRGWLDRILSRVTVQRLHHRERSERSERVIDIIYNALLLALAATLFMLGGRFVLSEVSIGEVGTTVLLGLATLGRVIVLLVFGTIIWTPVGVAIGFSPRLSRFAQPVVQLLASFPANFLFPFATLFFIRTGISLNWGGILLMSLGAQWYILFNVIAGAMSIPTDLREMSRNMGVRGWLLWRTVIIPGVFPAWVTGGITAAGGAWNASIVSEIVTWGSTTLTATGLGAYIARVTEHGDWPRIVLGVGTMSVFVVGFNRLLWRRLYRLAETRYRLG
ncbi:MAG TPA: ABC transporter permease subunit [Candidatus Kapabacteria bacterium]|nr:ABC transporter permease subunit [Candidatus Kapabacteria bacterium]